MQYFSQQCVGRLLAPAGIEVDAKLPLPEKLKHVQKLMDQGDYRARKIYQTIGTYLGYAIAHFTDFYDLENVLILGRVTSGPGGDIIIAGAKEVLKVEFPELTGRIAFHIPTKRTSAMARRSRRRACRSWDSLVQLKRHGVPIRLCL